MVARTPISDPIIGNEDEVLGPDGHSYAGIPLGTVEHNGKPVNVLRYTRAAQARSGREPRFCIEGYSHWNPASFFREHADRLEAESRLHRAAADIIDAHRAASS